jgi:hypothetical protein
MNIGLKEAARLSQKLGKVLRGPEPISALQAYEEETLAEWRQLLCLDRPVEVSSEAEAWVKAYAERVPSCVPASGQDLEILLRGIGLSMP